MYARDGSGVGVGPTPSFGSPGYPNIPLTSATDSYPHYPDINTHPQDITRMIAALSQQPGGGAGAGGGGAGGATNPDMSNLLSTFMGQQVQGQAQAQGQPTSSRTSSSSRSTSRPSSTTSSTMTSTNTTTTANVTPTAGTGAGGTAIPKRRPKRGRSSTLTQEERLKSRRLKHRQLDADRRSRLAAGFDTLQELTAKVTGLNPKHLSTTQDGSGSGSDEWEDDADDSGGESNPKKKKKKSSSTASTMKTDKASILILSSQVLYNLQQEVASLREQVDRERRAAHADGDDEDEVEYDTSQQPPTTLTPLSNLQCSIFLNGAMAMACYDMEGRLVDCNQVFLSTHSWPSRDACLGLPLLSHFFHEILKNHVHIRNPHLIKHYVNQPSTNPFYQKTITYPSPLVAARFAQPPTADDWNKLGPPSSHYPATAIDYKRLFNGEEASITTVDRMYDGEGHLYEEKWTYWLVYDQDRPIYLVGHAIQDTFMRLT